MFCLDSLCNTMAPYYQQHGRSFLPRKGNPLGNRTSWCNYGDEETSCPIFGISHLTPLSVGGRCTQPFHHGRSNREVHLQVNKGTGVEGIINNELYIDQRKWYFSDVNHRKGRYLHNVYLFICFKCSILLFNKQVTL